ncbi:MAG: DNA polymerase IV [Lachnospiraceae bacterium]|nr:DNA polymerase IV [Lachnospiraceae bacterium]
MKMEHLIFHVDVNSAFLSWSAVRRLKEDPGCVDLRDIPSAVGGDVKTRHGVITAKSIPAKKYGIHTGEPVVKALQKCPNLVLVESDFATYREYSRAFMQILKKHTPRMEQVSIDEAFLDMTGTQDRFPACEVIPGHSHPAEDETGCFPVSAADRIRREVRDTLGFTVNVGISVNRLLAKMASDFEKPDRTHTLWPEEVPARLWPLPIGELYGCGARTAERLANLGILTIGDAAAADPALLISLLGEKGGTYISESSRGAGSSEVEESADEMQSCSNETTTPTDITAVNYEKEALPVLKELSASVARRLQKDGCYAGTVTVSVKTDTFRRLSRQSALPESVNSEKDIYRAAEELLHRLLFGEDGNGGVFAKGGSVRLIGVGGTSLDRQEYRQLSLFEMEPPAKKDPRTDRIDAMLQDIRRQYGENAVRKGASRVQGRKRPET